MKNYILISFCLLCVMNTFAQSVDLESYLPVGFSRNGDIDYTKFLQKGFNEEKNIKMPNFPILINSSGLSIPSNRKITFQEKSKLILKPSNTRVYNMLNIDMVENIEIINAQLVGERQEKFNKNVRTGEWGMGISVRSSSNIMILGGVLESFWGDAIYLGKNNENKSITNSKVIIKDVHIRKARRNGISVTTGNNIVIENVKIEEVKGVSPEAALDIEPNGRFDEIKDISILNLETKNNVFGILISLRKLVDVKPKTISITIDNHVDSGAIQAFRYAGFNNAYNQSGLKKIEGQIIVKNSRWNNNKGTFTYEDGKNLLPDLIFKGLIYRGLSKNKKVEYNYQQWQYITKKQPNIKFISSDEK